MSRIQPIELANTEGKTRTTLEAIGKSLGVVPNLYTLAARAPSVLEGLAGLGAATAHGTLRPRVREAIALAVAEANGCDYCLSAHSVLGKGAGLGEADIDDARRGVSTDAKTAALLTFARLLVVERGRASEQSLATVRAAGASDPEILEVVANVVVNVFTNYLNLVADTDIDFPVVRAKRS